MATANQVPESSMEEILASIRKIISEGEAKEKEAGAARSVAEASLPKRPASNVSRLFGDDQRAEPAFSDDAPEAIAASEPSPVDFPVGEAHAPSRYPEFDEPGDVEEATGAAAPEPPEEGAPNALLPGALLSPRADAAVTSAFNHLASTILSNNTRTIEQLAEDMMRPMLKTWLDENLPPLVERLVREEIERVSRRR